MLKKIIILFILIGYLFNIPMKINFIENTYNKDWNYVYSYAIIKNNEKIASRYADVVVKHAHVNNIDVEINTRKIWKESKFSQHAKSWKNVVETNFTIMKNKVILTNIITNKVQIAYGASQVHLSQHDKKLWYVLDKKYAKRLQKDPNYKYKMIYFIEVNIATGTWILREELDKFDNDYSIGLTAYWSGANSSQTYALIHSNICNHYINDILNKEGYEDKMRKFNNWEYKEIKPVYSYKMITYNNL
jgi:hypothetical protein